MYQEGVFDAQITAAHIRIRGNPADERRMHDAIDTATGNDPVSQFRKSNACGFRDGTINGQYVRLSH